MKPRGKIVALSTLAVGTVVLSVAVMAARDSLRERWYMAKLGSQNPSDRLSAIHELTEMRSQGAVPRLLAILETEKLNEVSMISAEGL